VSFPGLPDALGKPLAVVLIDLLLAGDNAVVIALVCLWLPPRQLRWALLIGTLGAVVLRFSLIAMAAGLLMTPGLKLAGGLLLAPLAVNVARHQPAGAPTAGLDRRGGIFAAALSVMLIDALMSLDSVIALAAVAGDSWPYLALGLLISVAVLMFGSALVVRLLRHYSDLARLGAAMLGWVAAGLLVSDPLIAGWVRAQAPALPMLVPALGAAYVFLIGGAAPAPRAMLTYPVVPPRPQPAPAGPPPSGAAPLPGPSIAAEPQAPARGGGELVLLLALFVLGGLVIGAVALLAGGFGR
jgi:YjbE family integral membrane protein